MRNELLVSDQQVDLSYIVIGSLMSHLEGIHSQALIRKAAVAKVLSKIIGIGVGDSTVGPAVLEIINGLLKLLKKSAEREKTYDTSSAAPKQQAV